MRDARYTLEMAERVAIDGDPLSADALSRDAARAAPRGCATMCKCQITPRCARTHDSRQARQPPRAQSSTNRTFTPVQRSVELGDREWPLEIDRPRDAYTDDHLGVVDRLGIERFMVMDVVLTVTRRVRAQLSDADPDPA